MTPYQQDLGRAARQLDRAAERIERHGWVQGGPSDYHHLGFDVVGAIKPKANNPSPAIVHLAIWIAAEMAVYYDPRNVMNTLEWGMLFSPSRVLEEWNDRAGMRGTVAVRLLRAAAVYARQMQAEAA